MGKGGGGRSLTLQVPRARNEVVRELSSSQFFVTFGCCFTFKTHSSRGQSLPLDDCPVLLRKTKLQTVLKGSIAMAMFAGISFFSPPY